MDRLLSIEPSEVVLQFEVGRRCAGMFQLRNLMHTMPVAFKVQTTAPKKYGVKPPNGIIAPLGIANVAISYGPAPDLPAHYPFVQDAFVVKSVVVPSGAHLQHINFCDEWFSSKKRHIYSDMSLRIVVVGGAILRNLVATGTMESVREALERHVDVDSVDEAKGKAAMHVAVASKRPEMVQLLLEFDPDLEIRNKEGLTPWLLAVILQDSLSTELLLSNGADIEAKNQRGCRALHFAVSNGNLDLLRVLINHGADVNAAIQDGRTALFLAATNWDKECVRLLINKGAEIDTKDSQGMTPLHKVAARGDMALAKLLLSTGAEMEALTCDGKTPLDLAAQGGHKSLYYMLKMGDKLRSGAHKGNLETVRTCISQGAVVDGQDQYGWSALHHAAFKGHVDVVKYLIAKGADIQCRDEEGYTALHCATETGRLDVVQLLIARGANHNVKVKQGLTALQIAQKLNFSSLIRSLSTLGDRNNTGHVQSNIDQITAKRGSAVVKMLASHSIKNTMFAVPDRQCAIAG